MASAQNRPTSACLCSISMASEKNPGISSGWDPARPGPAMHDECSAMIVVGQDDGKSWTMFGANIQLLRTIKQLIAAIEAFISQHNKNPKPLRWTKSADDIRASIERFCQRTLDVHAQTGNF